MPSLAQRIRSPRPSTRVFSSFDRTRAGSGHSAPDVRQKILPPTVTGNFDKTLLTCEVSVLGRLIDDPATRVGGLDVRTRAGCPPRRPRGPDLTREVRRSR